MKTIWVTFRRKGLHKFPGASDVKFQDVNYLQFPHRHLFHFKITVEVFHNDREIEFHQFLNWLESLYDSSILALDYKSCEMISDDLAAQIQDRYPNRMLTIDISEDGECGATCHYSPKSHGGIKSKKEKEFLTEDQIIENERIMWTEEYNTIGHDK